MAARKNESSGKGRSRLVKAWMPYAGLSFLWLSLVASCMIFTIWAITNQRISHDDEQARASAVATRARPTRADTAPQLAPANADDRLPQTTTAGAQPVDLSRQTRNLFLIAAASLSLALLGAAIGRAVVTRRFRVLAETDDLTGLANRHFLLQTIRQRIHNGAPETLGLIYVDLDDFRTINDTLGHPMGDALLRRVSTRLRQCAAGEYLLARIGADEFVFLFDDRHALARAERIAHEIITAFRRPFGVRGSDYLINVSIGIALREQHEESEFGLLTQAELAMHAAKERGEGDGSRYQVYTPGLSSAATLLRERRQTLQHAITNHELFMVYQPIVSLSGGIRGLEALVRWKQPGKGVIGPDEFIPLAESTGLIVQLGEFVLQQACREFQAWQQDCDQRIFLSVNVSPLQLESGGLVQAVKQCLTSTRMDPDLLRLEITETAVLSGTRPVKARLQELRRLGVRLVLDDFGTGYSSLSQLLSQTFDGIKIDRQFTALAPEDPTAAVLTESLTRISRERGLSLVIEGVETKEQVDWLSRLGDVSLQGYYYSRPAPIGEFSFMLKAG